MRSILRTRRSLLVVLGAVAALAFWSSPAAAHQVRAEHGDDWARVGASHFDIIVTDAECDNHGVYAGFVTVGGHFYTVGDPDGCEVATGYRYSPDNTQIASFYICERTVGCSATKFVS